MNRSRTSRKASVVALLAVLFSLSCPTAFSLDASFSANEPGGHVWFFAQPSNADLSGAKRKVFAHYFPQFPRSIDNKPPDSDYYAREYLDPSGENGKHRSYDGFLRDRPLPRQPIAGADWRVIDKMTEIRWAQRAGVDGFTFDILATSGNNWTSLMELLEGIKRLDSGFRILLMPDMLGELKQYPERLVSIIELLHSDPSVYHLSDGRLVVAPYYANAQSPEWWQKQIQQVESEGIKIALVPVFQGWEKFSKTYGSFVSGFSDWGVANADDVPARASAPMQARAQGKLWMAPVRPQDFRPKNQLGFEAHNSELFRAMWQTAIDGGADWAQLITWNDYSECSEVAPSAQTGWVFYDLAAYYIAYFKTGSRPQVQRDAIYYTYRTQSAFAQSASTAGRDFLVNAPAAYNEIELLAALQQSAVIEIEIGGRHYTRAVSSGLQSLKVPAVPGTPQFHIIRNGQRVLTVTGAWEIGATPVQRDLMYHGDAIVGPDSPFPSTGKR